MYGCFFGFPRQITADLGSIYNTHLGLSHVDPIPMLNQLCGLCPSGTAQHDINGKEAKTEDGSIMVTGFMLASTVALGGGLDTNGTFVISAPSPIATTYAPNFASAFERTGASSVSIKQNNTSEGFNWTSTGKATVAFSNRPFSSAFDGSSSNVSFTLFAWDGLTPIVNSTNPVQNFSQEQLQNIFNGTTTSWSDFGGSNSNITICVLNSTSDGIEFLSHAFLFGNSAWTAPSSAVTFNTTEQLEQYVSTHPNAIGFSTYSSWRSNSNSGTSSYTSAAVDGVFPSTGTIQDGTYSFSFPVFATTSTSSEGSDASAFTGWLTSTEGQSFVSTQHLVPLSQGARAFKQFAFFGNTNFISNYNELSQQANNTVANVTESFTAEQ